MSEVSNASETTAVTDPPVAPLPADPPVAPPPADPPPYVAPQPSAHRTSAPVGWVIAAMLLFWPTGIPALLASHRAARAFGAADVEVAVRESANARRWGIISVIIGAVLVALSVLTTIVWAFVVAVAVHDHRDGGRDFGPRIGNQQPFAVPDGSGRQRSNG
ncbi:CD225/dispanin family protein [Cellulomonas sp. McL0617]|uniref:CD225/dispanin family protein n=1 Tax=Cellulomonas sp. McL0617 TaxID=3415675 RepID=UPI003CF6E52F